MLAGQELKGQSICMVTEPYTTHGFITGFSRQHVLVFDRKNKNRNLPPRAGIVADKSLGVTAMESWCSRDCAVATVKLHGKQTILVSLYLDINKPVVSPGLTDLMTMIDKKRCAVIICADSNAHSTLYGPDNNRRGDALEDFIIQNGLAVENIGNQPTFEVYRRNGMASSCIDVTLTRDLHFDLTNWRVDRGYNASDHNTILFESQATEVEKKKIRPWSKADWPTFTKHLTEADYRVPNNMSMKKLDRLVGRMYEVLEKALNRACPKIEVEARTSAAGWVTDEHIQMKATVSQLYKVAKTSGQESDWVKYKAKDKEYKRLCHRDKNKAWRKYKESIQSEKEMASLTKLAQREERREINVLTKADGSTTDPGKETIDLLTSTHFPAATETKRVTYNNRRNIDSELLRTKYGDWITQAKIKEALAGFEKKKSPGPDEIKPLLFDYLPEEFISALEIAYKAAIHLAYTPKEWKRTSVIYIAKPEKESYDKPKSFRPISLSNYLLKGLERLVGWNMDRALAQYPIHNKQHGFTIGKSTESAISNTVNYIEKFIMKKQHCVGVFLDISSAFDSIKPSHVRRALLDHGGDPEMVQWYFNYITHRDIEINMHGILALFSTGIGFPQGGVCSAKFWLIAFDYAIKIINRFNIEGNGYADDCSALYGGPRLDHAIGRLQKMLDELTAWGKSCGLKFNPEKSVAIIFTRRRKIPPKRLTIDGKEIEYKTEVKYLGVTLDSKLHWTKHIDDKIAKAKRYLANVANITRKNWGPKPKLMRWAYLGIVRPMLCYASMIWGHRAPEVEAKLRRVNRMAINTMGSFPKSTPTRALEIILDIMPLHLFCRQEALSARIRLDTVTVFGWDGENKNKTHCKSHLRHWQDCLLRYEIRPDGSDRYNALKWSAGFRVNKDSFSGEAKHRAVTQFNVFTDGSRQNDQTGLGLAIYKGTKEIKAESFRLPDHATVFQAEVTAITKAVKALETQTDAKFVKILVDSQAALQAVANPHITSKVVWRAVDALNRLAITARRITLVWIPAHKGHIGNERADELAKAGAASTDPTRLLTTEKSSAVLRSEIREKVYRDWADEWTKYNCAHHSKGFYAGPNRQKAKFTLKLARLELGRFVRIVTGHNNLRFFQAKLRTTINPKCRFCNNGYETITHLIQECDRFWVQRRELFGDKTPANDMKWSVRALLDFTYTPGINDAFEGETSDQDYSLVDVVDHEYDVDTAPNTDSD